MVEEEEVGRRAWAAAGAEKEPNGVPGRLPKLGEPSGLNVASPPVFSSSPPSPPSPSSSPPPLMTAATALPCRRRTSACSAFSVPISSRRLGSPSKHI